MQSARSEGANIPALDFDNRSCKRSGVVARLRTFLQVLMAVMALGIYDPSMPCAAAAPMDGMSCCCVASPDCKCPSDSPCQQSCTSSQTSTIDKQLPTRPVSLGATVLTSILWSRIEYPAFVPAFARRDIYASPLLSGGPPQARLCLWLV
jgi:hypothetical protein